MPVAVIPAIIAATEACAANPACAGAFMAAVGAAAQTASKAGSQGQVSTPSPQDPKDRCNEIYSQFSAKLAEVQEQMKHSRPSPRDVLALHRMTEEFDKECKNVKMSDPKKDPTAMRRAIADTMGVPSPK